MREHSVGDGAHETFYFSINEQYVAPLGDHFAFCKTARKPYDTVVMRVLLVLAAFFGERLRLSSDGSFREEWVESRTEIETRFGVRSWVEEQLHCDRAA